MRDASRFLAAISRNWTRVEVFEIDASGCQRSHVRQLSSIFMASPFDIGR